MPKLIITHGLPASGKSAWARKILKSDDNVVQVERDLIREELFGAEYHKGNFPSKSELQVRDLARSRIDEGLASGKSVIVSDTNLHRNTIAYLGDVAKKHGVDLEQKYFDVPVDECIRRNLVRGEAGDRSVPQKVIEDMARMSYGSDGRLKEFKLGSDGVAFAIPRSTPGQEEVEAFNKILRAENPFDGRAVVLIDVDGTLSANEHELNDAFGRGCKRNYAKFFKSIRDSRVNTNVVDLANTMRDSDQLNLVVLTGRSDSEAAALISFIERSGVKASRLIVKKQGDARKDFDFKSEQLDLLEAEGFELVHSIDDRPQSVEMYEARGIMVSKVPSHDPVHPDDAPAEYPLPEVDTIYGSGKCIRCGAHLKSGGNIGPDCAKRI